MGSTIKTDAFDSILKDLQHEMRREITLEGIDLVISPTRVNLKDGSPAGFELYFKALSEVIELPDDQNKLQQVMDKLPSLAKQAQSNPTELKKLLENFITTNL